MNLEDVTRQGVRILNAKQVKKLQPGAMVRVFIETKKGVTDTIAMVTQVGIHKRLMTMDGKLWRIADAPNHLYCLDE